MSIGSLRRLAILLLAAVVLSCAALVLAPLPRGNAGSTLCLPFVGPQVSIDSGLIGRDRALAIAHEEAHAVQCRKQGFFFNYVRRLSRSGRLAAELGAYCAEGKAERRFGHSADHIVARILDELQEGYPWFRGTPRSELARKLALTCPDLTSDAQHPSA